MMIGRIVTLMPDLLVTYDSMRWEGVRYGVNYGLETFRVEEPVYSWKEASIDPDEVSFIFGREGYGSWKYFSLTPKYLQFAIGEERLKK